MNPEKNLLFTPIKIGNRMASNRFVIQPMEFNDGIGSEDPAHRGDPTERTVARYRNLHQGDAGMIVLEAITVSEGFYARTHQLIDPAPQRQGPGQLRRGGQGGQPQAHLRRPADPFGRDQQPRDLHLHRAAPVPGLRLAPAHGRGRRPDHRTVRQRRQGRP